MRLPIIPPGYGSGRISAGFHPVFKSRHSCLLNSFPDTGSRVPDCRASGSSTEMRDVLPVIPRMEYSAAHLSWLLNKVAAEGLGTREPMPQSRNGARPQAIETACDIKKTDEWLNLYSGAPLTRIAAVDQPRIKQGDQARAVGVYSNGL